jgi:hypothetical protein
VKATLKVLIVWITLLALPLQGFASATMSFCALPMVTAQYDHDHASMADDETDVSALDEHVERVNQVDHHPGSHHQSNKCAACAVCNACVPMAPSFLVGLPVAASRSVTASFEQHILPSVYLALPERPPRA